MSSGRLTAPHLTLFIQPTQKTCERGAQGGQGGGMEVSWETRGNRRQLWGCLEGGGVVVQYVADPWHTRQLHFSRCSVSWRWAPLVPQPSSQNRFVCPHNLPAMGATQVVPSQGRLTSPSILYLSLSLTLCLHPLPLQPLVWRHKETPPWQR